MKRRDLLLAGVALPVLVAGSSSEAEANKKRKRQRQGRHKKEHRRNQEERRRGKRRKLRQDRRQDQRKAKNTGQDGNQGGGGNPGGISGMNVLLFITDQQRAIMHFPAGWAEQHLPGAQRLRQHGLTFPQAFCNSCMCSPSRATLLTGYFPAQHGVKYTLEEDMPADQYPQVELPLDLPNIATVMSAAGYNVPFKGKWHLSKMIGGDWAPEDVNQYGFQRWDPPDAGANQDIDQFGGGDPNNDGRFIHDAGPVALGREGALAYLQTEAAQQQPFFLTVSLVNPHDVLSYPRTYDQGGYTDADLQGTIDLPQTVGEDLSTKPTPQQAFLTLSSLGLGPLFTDQMKRDYLNFYGNLMRESDAYLVLILDTLRAQGLLDNTLIIQTSDHGEMGMTHGGQRQKNFNVYEETLRVPLVYSNPRLYPQPVQSPAMVSHVDFLPTLASLFRAPDAARANWQGKDYSRIVLHPTDAGIQDYIVFTYDDFQSGQASGPYVPPPNHITSLREGRYKLAKYYDVNGAVPQQWEMYDLLLDPLETRNIAFPGTVRTPQEESELQRLMARLAAVEQERLQPL